MHSPASQGAGDYGERAEVYLRLLAETVLRSATDGRADRVRDAAGVLVDAGVLADTVAAKILADLNVALRVRGWHPTRGLASRLRGMPGFMPGQPFEPPADRAQSWRVLPAGPGSRASRLMALILTADRVLAPATLFFPPEAGQPESGTPPLAQLTGADDAGTGYRLGFTDGTWTGSAWTGTVLFHPAPPAAARWLAIVSPNGQLLRADLSTAQGGHAPPIAALGPVRQTPGERLLTRRAEMTLAALALGSPVAERDWSGLGGVVATLEGAGALPPLSAVPPRLTALGRLLGLPAEGPADQVPARWTDVIAHYGRRRRLAPVTGTAAIAVGLPEIDGARFAIAGLRSGGAGTFLHVLVAGLRQPLPWRRPGRPADLGFSWWLRDDADGWHLGAVEDASPVGREAMLRLALLPPLSHATARLGAEIRGRSEQVAASLPVHW